MITIRSRLSQRKNKWWHFDTTPASVNRIVLSPDGRLKIFLNNKVTIDTAVKANGCNFTVAKGRKTLVQRLSKAERAKILSGPKKGKALPGKDVTRPLRAFRLFFDDKGICTNPPRGISKILIDESRYNRFEVYFDAPLKTGRKYEFNWVTCEFKRGMKIKKFSLSDEKFGHMANPPGVRPESPNSRQARRIIAEGVAIRASRRKKWLAHRDYWQKKRDGRRKKGGKGQRETFQVDLAEKMLVGIDKQFESLKRRWSRRIDKGYKGA